jgi:TRAP-type C4-dicarboxylate transport system permease small subunit
MANATLAKRIAKILGFIALVNFVAFLIGIFILGGDAITGHASDGHYYLGYHRHLKEVSRAEFVYSWWHTVSMFVTHALAMLAALFYRSLSGGTKT